ncbi:MAG: hypothetical protein LBP86_03720 [Azoarcus sp.]|jgi:hypothetical protein|nr:hypothetical protein [Azoarcus sp.]
MRCIPGVLAVACILAGCANSPPKPPLPKGDYRPINQAKPAQAVFDFAYEGDILGALPALRHLAPEITVLPASGRATPISIHVDLRGARLEDALRAIGAQGNGVADVVWNAARHQVFVRFRESEPAGKRN